MSNTYTWVISALEAYPQHEGNTDVVFNIHWRRNATDGTHSAEVYNVQPVVFEAGSPFTPYDQLTEAQVIGWLEASLGAEQLEALDATLDQQIANIINPPVVTPPLPWVA